MHIYESTSEAKARTGSAQAYNEPGDILGSAQARTENDPHPYIIDHT